MNKHRFQIGIGSILARRYRIISRLGVGGMGAVYLAEDLKLVGKQWAIKESLYHSQKPRTFEEEARLLVTLNHPYLPHIVDFFPPEENGFSYLVMEYIKGQTLQSLFESNRVMAFVPIIKYAIQLCEVFTYLHQFTPKPIIYRDLKPSNVMVDDQDNIRLIDFGIARNYSSEQDSDTVQLGTIGFAAPEQYLNKQTDARTDLFTLGALMYYLLSGGKFFSKENKSLSHFRPEISEPLHTIIHQLLMTDPINRIQEARIVKTALERIYLTFELNPTISLETLPVKSSISPKLIVIGGLYAGAGSTFTAIALARTLNYYGIPHALIEDPCVEPELFTLLDGQRMASVDYCFLTEWIQNQSTIERIHWRSGETEWIPLNPEGFRSVWNLESMYKLLFSVNQPIVIVDISQQWEEPLVKELCMQADEIIMVVDPSLVKLNSPTTLRKLEWAMSMQQKDKSVHLIANKDCKFSARNEWLTSIPIKPVAILPAIPYTNMLDTEWSGQLIQDKTEIIPLLVSSLQGLIVKLIPPAYLQKPVKAARKKWVLWSRKSYASVTK